MTKPYSLLAVAVDLITEEYKLSNPILIAEKAEEILDVELSVHQIVDYLEIEENYELESRKNYYQQSY